VSSIEHNLDSTKAEVPAVLQELADLAGITFNGDAPWDIQVHDTNVYEHLLTTGSLGFGEDYMNGLWDCYALDEFFEKVMRVRLDIKIQGMQKLRLLASILRTRLLNLQSHERAFQVGEEHYDTGNDIFEAMLDPTMSYSCGYWEKADTLEEAQIAKLDMICRKLRLAEGEKVLEIGCGWGGFARYAADNYGVEILGVTVSREQQQLAIEHCRGLPVTIELMDYRDITGQFDKAVSIGMFEHVGTKNYQTYFQTVLNVLKDEGLFLLHTIGSNLTTSTVDPWIDKYIFPNGKLPSAREITTAAEGVFLIEDWHNFGQDYDRTLMAWWDNFNRTWPQLRDRYNERFYRMWKYYLLSCAGMFRARQAQLWQLVLSKPQRKQIYRSLR
jgi:cyclopropane-fatty-acyl-phospholipid synthase